MSIDKLLTGRFTGLPIFILVMMTVFYLTFNVLGKLLSNLLSAAIDNTVEIISLALLRAGVNPAFHELVVNGVCAGVGSVLSFIPIIAVLFFFLSILEESGYLPKVAVLMDKPMMKIGLSGRCVVPMIMGFGCAVPAVLTAGSLLTERERRTTIAMIPFMSCSAKLPIYAVFTTVFFTSHRALAMAGIYATGVAVAVLYALISKPKISEVPLCNRKAPRTHYRFPNMRIVFGAVWLNVRGFIRKAFTVIFMASVIVWFLQSFDSSMNMVADSSHSLLALMGKLAAPIFAPLGFGDWRAASAVIAGLSAKEAVVSTFSVLSAAEGGSMTAMLSEIFSPLSAFSFMSFCLLYIPCIATLTAVRQQTGSWRLSIRMILSQTAIAWASAFIIYNIGSLLL